MWWARRDWPGYGPKNPITPSQPVPHGAPHSHPAARQRRGENPTRFAGGYLLCDAMASEGGNEDFLNYLSKGQQECRPSWATARHMCRAWPHPAPYRVKARRPCGACSMETALGRAYGGAGTGCCKGRALGTGKNVKFYVTPECRWNKTCEYCRRRKRKVRSNRVAAASGEGWRHHAIAGPTEWTLPRTGTAARWVRFHPNCVALRRLWRVAAGADAVWPKRPCARSLLWPSTHTLRTVLARSPAARATAATPVLPLSPSLATSHARQGAAWRGPLCVETL